MLLGTYLGRASIQAGLMLACTVPVVLIAVRRSRVRRWGLLLLVGFLVVVDEALLLLPRVDGFQQLRWNWQGKLLETTWPLLLAALVPGISLASLGVTSRLRPGWLKPTILALALALALPAVYFLLGAREALNREAWAFQLTMPGIAEELVFRGVYQSLLNRVFGKPWRFLNAEFGWGLIITAVLFAAGHVFSADRELHLHIALAAGVGPLIGSFIAGWIRERADSIWPGAVGHNLSNVLIPVASLFA